MSPSLRALLSGIIDYAGLFPPASLQLEQAIRNYAGYRTEPEAWMLGRFVCPAERLKELSPFVDELFENGSPLVVSVLGHTAKSIDDMSTATQKNLDDLAASRKEHGDRVVIDVIEIRMPNAIKSGEPQPREIKCHREEDPRSGPRRSTYYETELGADWRKPLEEFIRLQGTMRQFAQALSTIHKKPLGPQSRQPVGFKLRCGGVTAAAFPPPEQIAFALVSCRDVGIPFKATAGLHHPIRQYRDEVKTKMHGFLNVFGAGVLAHACELTEQQVWDIIVDEDPKNFLFDDTSFRWKEHRATVDQITAARQLVTSFGSCSFDEPRDDLRALGLL
jgi:hypothetical protein